MATVYGFARTMSRGDDLDERSARFMAMIEEASEQMAELLDELGAAARIESGRYEPVLRPAATLDLVPSGDERIGVEGAGEEIATDVEAVRRALLALAVAALRHGPVDRVTWRVEGRLLELSPVTAAAAPVVTGTEVKDLGSLVAGLVVEAMGGSIELAGETLRVRL